MQKYFQSWQQHDSLFFAAAARLHESPGCRQQSLQDYQFEAAVQEIPAPEPL